MRTDGSCRYCGEFCGESVFCSKECADADAFDTVDEKELAFERDEREEAA